MTPRVEYPLLKGPGRFDLMLSLFEDQEVRFTIQTEDGELEIWCAITALESYGLGTHDWLFKANLHTSVRISIEGFWVDNGRDQHEKIWAGAPAVSWGLGRTSPIFTPENYQRWAIIK